MLLLFHPGAMNVCNQPILAAASKQQTSKVQFQAFAHIHPIIRYLSEYQLTFFFYLKTPPNDNDPNMLLIYAAISVCGLFPCKGQGQPYLLINSK